MIRLMRQHEIPGLARLWLEASLSAHAFIPASFWQEKLKIVEREHLPAAVTYVYEEAGSLRGFLSVSGGNFIGGLFVAVADQRRGIGKALLEEAQLHYPCLELHVYVRNCEAVRFYLQNGFKPISFFKGDDTGEESIKMRWHK